MTQDVPKAEREVINLEWLRKLDRATVTRNEVARLYGVNPRTVDAGIADGSIQSIRLGKRIVIPREPLLAFLSAERAERPQLMEERERDEERL